MERLVALTIITIFAALTIMGIVRQTQPPSYADLVEERARAEAIQRKYEINTKVYVVVATTGVVVGVTVSVIAVTWLAGVAFLHVKRLSQFAKPDTNGLLPVSRDDTETAARALLAYHTARVADASRQPVPHHVTYSPRYDIDMSHDVRANDTRGTLLPGHVTNDVIPMTFSDLLRDNRIGRNQPLFLGYDVVTGEGIWGTWRELYSAGLGGVQGSGKTWTAVSLIAQSLLNNAQIILCDPHAGDAESLTTRLEPLAGSLDLIVDEPDRILQAALFGYEELERRKAAAREKQRYDRRQMILVLDEWTALLRGELHDKLPQVIQTITTEGRKYGVHALLIAQRWAAAASGGSDVRNTLTAHYVHRMRADEARMMTGLRGSVLPKDTLSLHAGQAYLLDTRGTIRKIATPYMTNEDVHRVAELLLPAAPEPASEPASEPAPEPANRNADITHCDAAKLSVEELRIVELFKAGASIQDIATELAGRKGGEKYQKSLKLISETLRKALR